MAYFNLPIKYFKTDLPYGKTSINDQTNLKLNSLGFISSLIVLRITYLVYSTLISISITLN